MINDIGAIIMKKMILATLISIGLAASPAMADGGEWEGLHFQTTRHRILIQDGPKETYIYKVWNNPGKSDRASRTLSSRTVRCGDLSAHRTGIVTEVPEDMISLQETS